MSMKYTKIETRNHESTLIENKRIVLIACYKTKKNLKKGEEKAKKNYSQVCVHFNHLCSLYL